MSKKCACVAPHNVTGAYSGCPNDAAPGSTLCMACQPSTTWRYIGDDFHDRAQKAP